MPYIKPELRKEVDKEINEIVDYLHRQTAGNDKEKEFWLRFTIENLVLELLNKRFGQVRYHLICMIDGVLSNVQKEIDRRIPCDNIITVNDTYRVNSVISNSVKNVFLKDINALVDKINGITKNDDNLVCGVLNYCITRIFLSTLKGRLIWHRNEAVAEIIHILDVVAKKIYDTISGPYENLKIAESGDLEEFKNLSI